jgi:hypothetical protein
MGAAIRRSLQPAIVALRGNVVRGPTGNLKRAISSKVKSYKSGNAVGLVGFVAAGSGKSKSAAGGSIKAGKDRAFHAGFLEFGTKERFIKNTGSKPYQRSSKLGTIHTVSGQGAAVASSFLRLGEFKLRKPSAKLLAAGYAPVSTTPKYPRAFFRKAAKGQALSLGEMSIGGSLGKPPVKSAFQESLSLTRQQLVIEMRRSLENATKETLWRNSR